MTGILQFRRSNTAGVIATTPADGELLVDTTLRMFRVGDGATAGGILLDGNRINTQTGTTYTVVATDASKFVTFSNASPVAVTLPQAGSVSGTFFPYQTSSWFLNLGAGLVTITPTTSTINGAATLVLNQGDGARIVSDGTNYFAFVTRQAAAYPTLDSLTDVVITSVSNGQFLKYDSGSGDWINSSPIITESKTTGYNILVADNGKHFDNISAAGSVNFNLPVAADELCYSFLVSAAQTVTVTAQTGERIAVGTVNSATGGTVSSNSPFSFLSLEAHAANQWVASSQTGSWTVT